MFVPRAHDEGLEGLVAAQVAGCLVLEEQGAGDGLDELADEVELFVAVRSAAQRAVMSTSMPMMAGRPSNAVRLPKTSRSMRPPSLRRP
jgi:hypothetical protein